jgi:hypothetical protein
MAGGRPKVMLRVLEKLSAFTSDLKRMLSVFKPIKNYTSVPHAYPSLSFCGIQPCHGFLRMEPELKCGFDGKPMNCPCLDRALRSLQVLGHEEHDLDWRWVK